MTKPLHADAEFPLLGARGVLDRSFDVPGGRRDITKITNVRWLLRNIRVKNSNHPRLDDMVEALKKQFKALRKKG